MIPQYSHNLLTSFMLWIDFKLTNDQSGFSNYSGQLYYQIDPSIPSPYTTIYASPYKSWVYDTCVTGASVPSGVWTSSGNFLTRASGISIDFIGGRVLSLYDRGPVTTAYSVKDFSLILSNEQETNFFLEKVFNENKSLTYTITGNQPGVWYAPCMVITAAQSENRPFIFGGIDESYWSIRAYVISNSNYLQEGVNSYFNDLARRYIPVASYGDYPLNSLGDLKTVYTGSLSGFCYNNNILQKYGYSGGCWINEVASYKMSEKSNKNITYTVSIVDFVTRQIRFTYNV